MESSVIQNIAEQTEIHKPNTPIENHLKFWQQTISKEHPQIKINEIKDFSKIPHNIISEIINKSQTETIEKTNTAMWNSQLANPVTIIEDLNTILKKNQMMFLNAEMAQAFAIRSIQGHAQNGHGRFLRKEGYKQMSDPYPNTTTENVLEAIEDLFPKKLKKRITKERFQTTSQQSNDNIVYCIENWFRKIEKNISSVNSMSNIIKLQDRKNKALNRISFFKGTNIDIIEFARGFYLTTCMDDFKKTRTDGFEKYFYQLGGGECYLTKTKELKKYGIGIRNFAKIDYKGIFKILNCTSHKTRINTLKELDIITEKTLPLEEIADGKFTWDKIKHHSNTTNLLKNPGHWGQYIREKWGRGVGDDLVIWLAGFLPPTIYNLKHKESALCHQSRIIGGLLGDQMDTSEKDAALFIPGGHDKIAGKHINGLYKRLARNKKFREKFNIKKREDGQYNLVKHNEIVDFTYAGANTSKEHVHSSQRWFYKSVQKTCAISEYIKYAYFCAKAQNQPVYLSDLKSFKIDLEKNVEKTKITFREIPLTKIREIMKERLSLVIDPKKREERLLKFYNKY